MINHDEIPFWIPFDGVKIPKNAIKAGKEGNQTLFIGRALHERSLTPGKIYETERTCVIPWGCRSNIKTDYEVLVCGCSNWVSAQRGNIPENAFPGGHSEQGETLYIGRVMHDNQIVVGKVQPSHTVCYIAYGDEELNFSKYEVLVV